MPPLPGPHQETHTSQETGELWGMVGSALRGPIWGCMVWGGGSAQYTCAGPTYVQGPYVCRVYVCAGSTRVQELACPAQAMGLPRPTKPPPFILT